MTGLEKLREIVRLMDEAYDHYFATSDGHCKTSEGYVGLGFNNYFERKAGEPLRVAQVEIYSYVLGPSRSHYFGSVDEALATVREWHRNEMSADG